MPARHSGRLESAGKLARRGPAPQQPIFATASLHALLRSPERISASCSSLLAKGFGGGGGALAMFFRYGHANFLAASPNDPRALAAAIRTP